MSHVNSSISRTFKGNLNCIRVVFPSVKKVAAIPEDATAMQVNFFNFKVVDNNVKPIFTCFWDDIPPFFFTFWKSVLYVARGILFVATRLSVYHKKSMQFYFFGKQNSCFRKTCVRR